MYPIYTKAQLSYSAPIWGQNSQIYFKLVCVSNIHSFNESPTVAGRLEGEWDIFRSIDNC